MAKEVPATINVHQFAQAMQAFDATGIPPHKMARARYEHFLKVMLGSMTKADAQRVVADAMAHERMAMNVATRPKLIV